MSLVGYGRGSHVHSVSAANLFPSANGIHYRRNGITEWYVNGVRGLKQGFTLSVPPERVDDQAQNATDLATPILLELKLESDLSASIGVAGQAVDLFAADGRRALRYAELEVFDATGRVLPAHLELFKESGSARVQIVVDDRGAAYPELARIRPGAPYRSRTGTRNRPPCVAGRPALDGRGEIGGNALLPGPCDLL